MVPRWRPSGSTTAAQRRKHGLGWRWIRGHIELARFRRPRARSMMDPALSATVARLSGVAQALATNLAAINDALERSVPTSAYTHAHTHTHRLNDDGPRPSVLANKPIVDGLADALVRRYPRPTALRHLDTHADRHRHRHGTDQGIGTRTCTDDGVWRWRTQTRFERMSPGAASVQSPTV
jgi:hypothetical protein